VNYIVLSELKILNECESVIPIAFVQERGSASGENEHHTLGFQLFTKKAHSDIHHMALLWSKNHGYPYHSHIRTPVSLDDMGIVWKFTKYTAFPYQMTVWLIIWECMGSCPVHIISIVGCQETYGNGMGLSHVIPILLTMGNVWGAAKYVPIP